MGILYCAIHKNLNWNDEVIDLPEGEQPGVIKRKKIGERILNKLLSFVATFIDGMDG